MRLIPNLRRKGQASKSPPKKKISNLAKSEERAAYLFLSPWIIGFIVLLVGPIIASVYLSMNEWSLVSPPQLGRVGELREDGQRPRIPYLLKGYFALPGNVSACIPGHRLWAGSAAQSKAAW